MDVLYTFLLLGGLGLLFGIILAVCAKVFYVKEDTRVEDVKNMLPNYNCGACGYPGCGGFAEALVNNKENDPSKCKPSKQDDLKNIKEYLDKNC